MDQFEVVEEIKSRLKGLKDIAEEANVSYPYLTQIMNFEVRAGERILKKLSKYLENGKS